MDENNKPVRPLPSKDEIMLALTTVYNKDYEFLDDVNRVTFGLKSNRKKSNVHTGQYHR